MTYDSHWKVGAENTRESKRFRYPLIGDRATWPWMAMFERWEDAAVAAERHNGYFSVTQENISLRNRIFVLESRLLVYEPKPEKDESDAETQDLQPPVHEPGQAPA